MTIEKYEVLEHDDHSGLTVDSFSKKPGETFTNKQWMWGDEALAEAVKTKRCKKISSPKKDEKKSEGKK